MYYLITNSLEKAIVGIWDWHYTSASAL